MPRYFFHIRQPDNSLTPDDEGGEFEDIESARHEAAESIRDIVADNVKKKRSVYGLAIELADEKGMVLASFPAEEVFR